MPDNPFAEERQKRTASANPFSDERTFRRNVVGQRPGLADWAAESMGNTLMALPRGLGRIAGAGLSATSAGLQGIGGGGSVAERGSSFQDRFAAEQNKFPASFLNNIPALTVRDIGAGIQSAPALTPGGESFGDAYTRNRQNLADLEAADRAEAPIKSTFGDALGVGGALAFGRAPLAKPIRNLEHRMFPPGGPNLPDRPGISGWLLERVGKPLLGRTGRGAVRALETGAEAAILEASLGDDPITAAAYGAGGQVASSLGLTVANAVMNPLGPKFSKSLNLAAGAAGGLAIIQLAKTMLPGGLDRILESEEAAYDKIMYALAAGAVGGMVGGGRGRENLLAEKAPQVMDAIASFPRGTALGLLTKWVEASPDEQQSIESVLNNIASNPDYEGASDIEKEIIQLASRRPHHAGRR